MGCIMLYDSDLLPLQPMLDMPVFIFLVTVCCLRKLWIWFLSQGREWFEYWNMV